MQSLTDIKRAIDALPLTADGLEGLLCAIERYADALSWDRTLKGADHAHDAIIDALIRAEAIEQITDEERDEMAKDAADEARFEMMREPA